MIEGSSHSRGFVCLVSASITVMRSIIVTINRGIITITITTTITSINITINCPKPWGRK